MPKLSAALASISTFGVVDGVGHRPERCAARVDRGHAVGICRDVQVAERVQAEAGGRGHAGVVNRRGIVGIQARARHRNADDAAALRNIDGAGGIDSKPRYRWRETAGDGRLTTPGGDLDEVGAVSDEDVAGVVDRNRSGLGEARCRQCPCLPSPQSAGCRFAQRARWTGLRRRRCWHHPPRAAHCFPAPSSASSGRRVRRTDD